MKSYSYLSKFSNKVEIEPSIHIDKFKNLTYIENDIIKNKVEMLENIICEKDIEINNCIEREKMRTEFFADISHDLRTPLNVILGAVQLLGFQMSKKTIYDETGKLDDYLSTVKFNALRLLRLVNNVIDVTKLDSESNDVELKMCNIVSFVEDVANSVIPYMENKNITMTFDTEEEEIYLLIDPVKMERVILNILSNAIKFTPEGGKVFVRVTFDEDVKISIKDNGIGMSEDKIKVIFERFKQANNGYIRDNEGSGIGLSLAKSIIDQHGGKIKVKSKLGEGSKFTIVFPKTKVDASNKRLDLFEYNLCTTEIELADICYKK